MLEYCKEKGFKLFIELPDHVLPIFKNDIYSSFELFEVQIEKIKRYLKEYSNYAGILLMDEKVKTYLERYLNKDPIKGSCPLGYTDIYIGSEGNVYSGCWVLPSIGNIREQDINQIMKGEKYHNNIEHMIQKNVPPVHVHICFKLNLWTNHK